MYKAPYDITIYRVDGTQFGLLHKTYVSWYDCRDLFRLYFAICEHKEGFLFRVPDKGKKKALKVLRKRVAQLQKRMKLKEKDWLEVQSTARPDCVYIRLSKFWQQTHRLCFLSAFLRAAKDVKRDSLKKVLKEGKYLKNTQPAVNRFIKGHTKLKLPEGIGRFRGWNRMFRKKKRSEVAAILV